MLPSFVVIGAQRAGTSWLARCLSEHPQIGTASRKEVHFFDVDANWAQGVDWYERFFAQCKDDLAIGEATPEYVWKKEAPSRMASVIPEAKLIVILRNPIDRALSAYWLRRTMHPGVSFEKAVAGDIDDILSRGLYAEQLERVYAVYPKESVLVMLYDDLRANDRSFLRQIYRFLGVESGFAPSWLGKTHNAVIFPRTQDALRAVRLGWTVNVVKNSPLGSLIRKLHRSAPNPTYPKMSAQMRKQLQQHFAEPNTRLSRLLGRKLPWD